LLGRRGRSFAQPAGIPLPEIPREKNPGNPEHLSIAQKIGLAGVSLWLIERPKKPEH